MLNSGEYEEYEEALSQKRYVWGCLEDVDLKTMNL